MKPGFKKCLSVDNMETLQRNVTTQFPNYIKIYLNNTTDYSAKSCMGDS